MAQNSKSYYDLEDRTLKFSQDVLAFTKTLPRTMINLELIKQFIRSSTSVGANYVEANEALGKKDFLYRARIARKEAKETRYWLRLIEVGAEHEEERQKLYQEVTEIMKILGSIIVNRMKGS
ncbi:MAG: four helix bundle protein [Candidatus Uhrbacteria bacterium]|nr:four helix bundle protein [Candidatus Uhrbacteria bacterium]